MERLTKSDILRALEQLAVALPPVERPRELWVVGGAALVLLFEARETTRDVNAFLLNAEDAVGLRAASRSVAAALSLPENWLADGARGYLRGLAPGEVLLSTPQLVVRAVATHQLLAMKLSACRDDRDIADARLLLLHLPGERESIWRLIEPHLVRGRELNAQYVFDDLWQAERARK